MPQFVYFLIVSTAAAAAWCVGDAVRRRTINGKRVPLGATSAVLAVAALGAFLRYDVATPHLAMYIDEPWYAEAACNLARNGRLEVCEEKWTGRSCSEFEKAPGWPALLSLWIAVRGCAMSAGIEVSQVLGTATPIVVAIAAALAGADRWTAALAAFTVAIHPVHVKWSATGETNVAAAFVLLVALCGALLYIRHGARSGASLATAAFALATSIRPESLVAALVAATISFIAHRRDGWRGVAAPGAIAIMSAIAAAGTSRLWTMNEEISGGSFFAAGNIVANATALDATVHGVAALFAVAGAAAMLRAGRRTGAAMLFGVAVAAASAALSYDRFTERMLLAAIVSAAPLTAFAFALCPPLPRCFAAALLAALWWHETPAGLEPSATQQLETRIVRAIARQPFPDGALFITAQPTILAATGSARVMSTSEALGKPGELANLVRGGAVVFYLHDMFCDELFAGGASAPLCRRMSEEFVLTPAIEESFPPHGYILYAVASGEGR